MSNNRSLENRDIEGDEGDIEGENGDFEGDEGDFRIEIYQIPLHQLHLWDRERS